VSAKSRLRYPLCVIKISTDIGFMMYANLYGRSPLRRNGNGLRYITWGKSGYIQDTDSFAASVSFMEFLKLLSYFPYDGIPDLTETTRVHLQFDFLQLSHENEVIKRLAETHVKAIIREQRLGTDRPLYMSSKGHRDRMCCNRF